MFTEYVFCLLDVSHDPHMVLELMDVRGDGSLYIELMGKHCWLHHYCLL